MAVEATVGEARCIHHLCHRKCLKSFRTEQSAGLIQYPAMALRHLLSMTLISRFSNGTIDIYMIIIIVSHYR